MERKLAAILSADGKGYSRLMAEDEVATVRTLTAYRELMSSLIPQHRGRVVDSTGDNLLAEFPSVVDAVLCAAEIQQALKARKAALSRAESASRARPMIRSRARSGFATSISASKPSRTSRSPCGCTGYGSPPGARPRARGRRARP